MTDLASYTGITIVWLVENENLCMYPSGQNIEQFNLCNCVNNLSFDRMTGLLKFELHYFIYSLAQKKYSEMANV